MSQHKNETHHEHISPLSMYFAVFGALIVLTVLTVAVSYMGLGKASIWVAMVVALAKASLVAMYFMHLKWDDKLNQLTFIISLVFMSFFFIFVALDIGYRGEVVPETDTFVLQHEEQAAAEEAARLEAAAAAEAAAALQAAPAAVPPGQAPPAAGQPAPGPAFAPAPATNPARPWLAPGPARVPLPGR